MNEELNCWRWRMWMPEQRTLAHVSRKIPSFADFHDSKKDWFCFLFPPKPHRQRPMRSKSVTSNFGCKSIANCTWRWVPWWSCGLRAIAAWKYYTSGWPSSFDCKSEESVVVHMWITHQMKKYPLEFLAISSHQIDYTVGKQCSLGS